MMVIGLTGGIGSGKSEVTRHFETLNVPVYDADVIAKSLVEPEQPALKEIIDKFGPDIITSDGELDRTQLRNIVFNKPQQPLHPLFIHPIGHIHHIRIQTPQPQQPRNRLIIQINRPARAVTILKCRPKIIPFFMRNTFIPVTKGMTYIYREPCKLRIVHINN